MFISFTAWNTCEIKSNQSYLKAFLMYLSEWDSDFDSLLFVKDILLQLSAWCQSTSLLLCSSLLFLPLRKSYQNWLAAVIRLYMKDLCWKAVMSFCPSGSYDEVEAGCHPTLYNNLSWEIQKCHGLLIESYLRFCWQTWCLKTLRCVCGAGGTHNALLVFPSLASMQNLKDAWIFLSC